MMYRASFNTHFHWFRIKGDKTRVLSVNESELLLSLAISVSSFSSTFLPSSISHFFPSLFLVFPPHTPPFILFYQPLMPIQKLMSQIPKEDAPWNTTEHRPGRQCSLETEPTEQKPVAMLNSFSGNYQLNILTTFTCYKGDSAPVK